MMFVNLSVTWHPCSRLRLPQVKPCYSSGSSSSAPDDVVTPLPRHQLRPSQPRARNNERTEITARKGMTADQKRQQPNDNPLGGLAKLITCASKGLD